MPVTNAAMLLRRIFIAAALLFVGACAQPDSGATFVDVVWKVASSPTVAPETLYVFLSDGTLVITRRGDKPMIGAWTRDQDGITMIEDGLKYRTEVLHVTPRTLHIRSHNPGEPVDIHLVRAETS